MDAVSNLPKFAVRPKSQVTDFSNKMIFNDHSVLLGVIQKLKKQVLVTQSSSQVIEKFVDQGDDDDEE